MGSKVLALGHVSSKQLHSMLHVAEFTYSTRVINRILYVIIVLTATYLHEGYGVFSIAPGWHYYFKYICAH